MKIKVVYISCLFFWQPVVALESLPAPIIPDDQQAAIGVLAKPEPSIWVVQLASGNESALIQQARGLQASWSDVRVVLIDGQAKLVVGAWRSTRDATQALTQLRQVSAGAFIRRLPTVMPRSSPATAVVNPVSENVESDGNQSKQTGTPMVDDMLPAVVAVASATGVEEDKPTGLVSSQPLMMPVNMMLSPLYLLPSDPDRVKPVNQLTMAGVVQALWSSNRQAPPPIRSTADTALFSQMAALAQAGKWPLAMPLAQEAERIAGDQLSDFEQLLLGWVWLQNNRFVEAIKHFTLSLKLSGKDEARYGLALAYVMVHDRQQAVALYQQMSESQQRQHLQQLLF